MIAFVKINEQTFHYFLLNFFQTIKKPSLRNWKKEYSKEELNYLRKQGSEMEEEFKQEKKIVRAGHIRDLSLLVNTGGYYKPDTKDF